MIVLEKRRVKIKQKGRSRGARKTSPHQPADVERANGVGNRSEATCNPADAAGREPCLRAGVVHLRAVAVQRNMDFSVRGGYAEGDHVVRVVRGQLVRKLEDRPFTGGELSTRKNGSPRRGVPGRILPVAMSQHARQLEGVDVDDAIVRDEKDAVGIELGVRYEGNARRRSTCRDDHEKEAKKEGQTLHLSMCNQV